MSLFRYNKLQFSSFWKENPQSDSLTKGFQTRIELTRVFFGPPWLSTVGINTCVDSSFLLDVKARPPQLHKKQEKKKPLTENCNAFIKLESS